MNFSGNFLLSWFIDSTLSRILSSKISISNFISNKQRLQQHILKKKRIKNTPIPLKIMRKIHQILMRLNLWISEMTIFLSKIFFPKHIWSKKNFLNTQKKTNKPNHPSSNRDLSADTVALLLRIHKLKFFAHSNVI